MSKTPQDFYNQYNGKRIDQDGAYGALNVATSGALGAPNTQTTVRVRGWYYH